MDVIAGWVHLLKMPLVHTNKGAKQYWRQKENMLLSNEQFKTNQDRKFNICL